MHKIKTYLYQLATDQKNHATAKILKGILYILSLGYGVGVAAILWCYRKGILKKSVLSQPVISVGNVTLGGVGKTPFVIFLSERLKEKGLKPAVLTRGYTVNKAQGFEGKESLSDEAVLLQETLNEVPVYVGVDRFRMAQTALRKGTVDVFILDDGFQHWRLNRDLDIVLIDSTNPFGNKNILPRGILREPLKNLKRADIFVLTKINLPGADVQGTKKVLTALNPKAVVAESIHEPLFLSDLRTKEFDKELSFLKQKKICTLCSIGDPRAFHEMLLKQDAYIDKNFVFMDHHVYSSEDIREIVQYCRANQIKTLVTTEKDTVKLEPYLEDLLGAFDLLALKIQIKIIKGQDEVFHRISQLYCH